MGWVIGIIIAIAIIIWLVKAVIIPFLGGVWCFLLFLAFNSLFYIDNMLAVSIAVPSFIMWLLFGAVIGAAVGVARISRRLNMPHLHPLSWAVPTLLVVGMNIVSNPFVIRKYDSNAWDVAGVPQRAAYGAKGRVAEQSKVSQGYRPTGEQPRPTAGSTRKPATYRGYVENRGTGPLTVRNSQRSAADVIQPGSFRVYELEAKTTTFYMNGERGTVGNVTLTREKIASAAKYNYRGENYSWHVWGSPAAGVSKSPVQGAPDEPTPPSSEAQWDETPGSDGAERSWARRGRGSQEATGEESARGAPPVDSRAPSTADFRTVSVSSQYRATPTGVFLRQGDAFTISATGTTSDDCGKQGPDGAAARGDPVAYVVPNARLMCLIGRIGDRGRWFVVGSRYSGTADLDGQIFLMTNDADKAGAYRDNRGSYDAEIHVTRARTRSEPSTAPSGGRTILVLVRSDPPGASISVDGAARGRTPVALDLSPGRHRIDLSLDGYEPVSDQEIAVGDTAGGTFGFAMRPVRRHVFKEGRSNFTLQRAHDLEAVWPKKTPVRITWRVGCPGGSRAGGKVYFYASSDNSDWRELDSKSYPAGGGRVNTTELFVPTFPFRYVKVKAPRNYCDYSSAEVNW